MKELSAENEPSNPNPAPATLFIPWGCRVCMLLSIICLLAFGYATFDLVSTHLSAKKQLLTIAEQETRSNAEQLGGQLRDVEQLTLSLVQELSDAPHSQGSLEARLRDILERNPKVYGVGLSFLPDHNPVGKRLYAPYVIRQGDELRRVNIEDSYDYTAAGNTWFHQPLNEGPGWVPVYWGDAGQSMMATYAAVVPDRQGQPQAVLTIDLALNDIWRMVAGLNFGSTSYGFLIDSDGKLIAHPLKEMVLEKRRLEHLFSDDGEGSFIAATRALELGQHVVLDQSNAVTGQPSLTVLIPVPEAGWFMGATFVKEELELADHDARQLWIRLVAAAVFLVISIALLYLTRDRTLMVRRLHTVAVVCGVTLAIGLAALWSLQHMMGVESPYSDQILDSQAGVKTFQEELTWHNQTSHLRAPMFVPTGVLLRALKMTELNEVQATGILWQSYPFDTPAEERQFWFPDALSTELQEIYRVRRDGREVVGWAFDTRLRQTFDNRAYPFDAISVRFRIRPRGTFGQTVYVPDLEAYDVVIPSAKPFVASNISIPGWKIVQTYFRPQSHGYGMNYGLHGSPVDPIVRDLVLVTTLKRNLMDNFISVIIPVLVLLLLSYGAIMMTSGDGSKVSIYDFKPMRMLMVGTSFCLFLILATINMRNRVVSDEIIYIEKLYFLLYFLAFGNVFIAMKIANRSNRFLSYQDGRLVKAFYFPAVMGVIFLITLFSFHT